MTDLHIHILPGVDDGAADWEESRQMLQFAYEQGIHSLIATPHFSGKQDTEDLAERAAKLQEMALEIDPKIRVFLGQENLYSTELLEDLKSERALTMAGSRYVLVEFMPDAGWQTLQKACRDLVNGGYYPIFAHIERYEALHEARRIDELIRAGCYMQMNYKSLTGSIWNMQTRWCRTQVLEGRVHLLGTDAHHMKYRRPRTDEAMEWLRKKVSEDQIQNLTQNNAQHILANRRISPTT